MRLRNLWYALSLDPIPELFIAITMPVRTHTFVEVSLHELPGDCLRSQCPSPLLFTQHTFWSSINMPHDIKLIDIILLNVCFTEVKDVLDN